MINFPQMGNDMDNISIEEILKTIENKIYKQKIQKVRLFENGLFKLDLIQKLAYDFVSNLIKDVDIKLDLNIKEIHAINFSIQKLKNYEGDIEIKLLEINDEERFIVVQILDVAKMFEFVILFKINGDDKEILKLKLNLEERGYTTNIEKEVEKEIEKKYLEKEEVMWF